LNELLKEYAAVVSLLTFLFGLIIGNRLAISRDRRREFNSFVQPIRSWLLSELEEPSRNRKTPSKIEMDNFIHCLTIRKRKKFQTYLTEFGKIKEKNSCVNEVGQVFYQNKEEIKTIVKKCIYYAEKK